MHAHAAIDGIKFELTQQKDLVKDYKLENFKALSLQDIENKVSPGANAAYVHHDLYSLPFLFLQYNYDFSKWKPLANQT